MNDYSDIIEDLRAGNPQSMALAANILESLQHRAIQDVVAERENQIAQGWTLDHDDSHDDGWIAEAAADLMMNGQYPIPGSWAWKHKHPKSQTRKSRRDQLVIATA